MNYSAKVDLFKRFNDDIQLSMNFEIINYEKVINNLKEAGRFRNLVVHADWWNTDNDGYTYVNLKISRQGIRQEYIQFSEDSLIKISDLIKETKKDLDDYCEKKDEIIQSH